MKKIDFKLIISVLALLTTAHINGSNFSVSKKVKQLRKSLKKSPFSMSIIQEASMDTDFNSGVTYSTISSLYYTPTAKNSYRLRSIWSLEDPRYSENVSSVDRLELKYYRNNVLNEKKYNLTGGFASDLRYLPNDKSRQKGNDGHLRVSGSLSKKFANGYSQSFTAYFAKKFLNQTRTSTSSDYYTYLVNSHSFNLGNKFSAGLTFEYIHHVLLSNQTKHAFYFTPGLSYRLSKDVSSAVSLSTAPSYSGDGRLLSKDWTKNVSLDVSLSLSAF